MKALLRTTLAALLLSPFAAAHTFTLSLGPAAGAVDYFGVICSNESGADTDHLQMQVRTETVGGPLVSVQVRKGEVVTNTTDPINGDAEFSQVTNTPGGNGLYGVTVTKTGAGSVVFTLTVHCLNKAGDIHTGTDGVVYQYQP
ncbi:hypothetical protein [Chitinimonas sp.]|uniref:hypothetical protein n=1 Tax=Chitinimonas sp. TaxID=1934313 RepID=UPI0035B127CB